MSGKTESADFLNRCNKLGKARELDSRAYVTADDLEAGVILKFKALDVSNADAEKHEALFTNPDSPESDRVWKIGAAQIVQMAVNGILIAGGTYGIRKAEVVKSSKTPGRTVGRYQVVQIGE
jgi:hypothetical protein